MRARRVTVRAPAKVNLSLAVLGRRPDGFHEVDTVLMALALGDGLEVLEQAGEECVLVVAGPAAAGVPMDDSNLALRAARAVRALAVARGRAPRGVRLALEKHVPAEAGLGGGSADAAAAALACALLFDLDPDDPDVLAALAPLGSDCAFFLVARASGLARCTGRGERVEPLPPLVLPWSLAVVTPPFGCGTAGVYGAFAEGPPSPGGAPTFDPQALRGLAPGDLRARLVNDLVPAALRAYPALADFHALLEEAAPGTFQLAGSGSSWFGFFADAHAAHAALARVDVVSRARRFALRGRWVLPAASRGLEGCASDLH